MDPLNSRLEPGRRFLRRGLVMLLALVPAGAFAASVPDGLVLGPWVLAPYLAADLGFESNLLRKENNDDPTETSASAEFGLTATLPFRNSFLEFELEADDQAYKNFTTDNSSSVDTRVLLELNLASGDTLKFKDRFTRDYIQLRDEFGDAAAIDTEDIFIGQPYNYNTWSVSLDRDVSDRQGFSMEVSREDLTYEGVDTGDVGFFERRGFDTVFEYRQPLPSSRSIVAFYNQRRFNHYRPDGSDGVGVPFRKELSDYYQLGLRGSQAANSYLVRLGYSKFEYEGEDSNILGGSSVFRGVSGFAYWRISLGGGSGLNLSFSRRPLPSNFPTYYISNVLRVGFDRSRREQSVEFNAGLSRNKYADDLTDLVPELRCDGRRDDFRFDVQARYRWKVHTRFAFQLAADHERRRSNCDGVGYVSNEIEAGVVVGWF